MLLRIDKVSGGNAPNDPPPPSSTDLPLHACLATAPIDNTIGSSSGDNDAVTQGPTQGAASQIVRGHAVIPDNDNASNRTGEIVTVGRKNCAVTIEDKCVSRRHAIISLLSNRPLEMEGDPAELIGGRVMMEYGTPSTPEEIKACDTSPSGVICVVKDCGSKFGTFVSVEEDLVKKYSLTNDDDAGDETGGDETGDETDDEAGAASGKSMNYVQLSEKQSRAVHFLSDGNDPNNSALKFQKLAVHQSVPLLQLSHSKTTSSSPHVILLFGPQGSAIRLSLLPLQFTFSRYKSPQLAPILSCLHYIGATHSSQWDCTHSTHLVAPEKTAAAKGIMAYACRRPVVTKAYIEALLERRQVDEELPKEEYYCPSGTWDRNLLHTPEPSTALAGYRIAILVDDDNGPLAQSAGASILPIHQNAPTSSHAAFHTWWTSQKLQAREDKLALVVVVSSSKKCKQFHDWLKAEEEEVRFTNAKNLAKAITGRNGEGDLLLDVRKVVIEKMDGWDDKREKHDCADKTAEKVPEVDASATSVKAGTEAIPETRNTAKTHEDETPEDENMFAPNNDGDDDFQQEEPEEEIPVSTKRKRRQETDNNAMEKNERQPERQRRRREKVEDEVVKNVDQAGEPAVEAEECTPEEIEPPVDNEPTAETSKSSAKSASNNQRRNRKEPESSEEDEPGLPTKRIPLPTTDDGWFVAAPKRRKAYRKEIDEEEDGNNPASAAETEKVSGLIVRKYVPPNQRRGVGSGNGGRNVGRAASSKKKKDFKGFRKNNVLRGYTSFNSYGRRQQYHSDSHLPKIRLVERMPKESERQRQLQQQQQDLEREQELADQLFNDTGVGAGSKSGRKRGGTMHAFLTQSTTKRGRGRR